MDLTDEEVEGLRSYLEAGGFLIVDQGRADVGVKQNQPIRSGHLHERLERPRIAGLDPVQQAFFRRVAWLWPNVVSHHSNE